MFICGRIALLPAAMALYTMPTCKEGKGNTSHHLPTKDTLSNYIALCSLDIEDFSRDRGTLNGLMAR